MIYNVTIPRSTENFLSILNVLLESKMSKREIEVLGCIINYNIEYNALPMDKRMSFIFSSSTKKDIQKLLNMKAPQLANCLKALEAKTFAGIPIVSKAGLNPQLNFSSLPENILFKLEETDDRHTEDTEESSGEARPETQASGAIVETLRAVVGEEPTLILGGDNDTQLGQVSGETQNNGREEPEYKEEIEE